NEVSDNMIKNCWNSIGILSDITNSNESEPDQFFMDTDDDNYETIDFTNDGTFDPESAATDSEEDEVPLAPPVNLSVAINALQLLIQFQEQRKSDDGFKSEELNMLYKKLYHFEKLKKSKPIFFTILIMALKIYLR
ncbi:1036_t:CDS:2, partial [Dentiscutata erythropus]